MMRIVLIHRYFSPDSVPYAEILRQIAAHLGGLGHEVEVLTCQPSYRPPEGGRAPRLERLGSQITVRRWPVLPDRRSAALKAVNLVSYCAWLLFRSFRTGKVDVVMAASTPPVAVARVASWLARRCGARFVYHKQDIYPDVMVAARVLRAPRLAVLLQRIDARTERRADRVVVLSRDMAETIRRRGVEAGRIAVINNFDPWAPGAGPGVDGSRRPDRGPGERLHVAFAGSLGRFQNLETVVAALTTLGNDPQIAFHFFGDGSLRGFVEREVAKHGLTNVRVYGYRPPHEVAQFLRVKADIGIVSLPPGMIWAAYPSRTMAYLRHGCPVLALVDKDSELAETIVRAGAGVQADPDSAAQLADTLWDLAYRPSTLLGARKCAIDLYRTHFEAGRQLDRWTELFERVAERNRPTVRRSVA
jgi:glycosyltransferase involved in cell wall biosynthesis